MLLKYIFDRLMACHGLLMLIPLLLIVTNISAQVSIEELKANVCRAASYYYAYPEPDAKQLTLAPKGKKPFYINHYGRHGSRYLALQEQYDAPYQTLMKADSLGKLNDMGKMVLRNVTLFRQEAYSRLGELTPIGAKQLSEIASRMYERFPEVFEECTHIEARSTLYIRCILSMHHALIQLAKLNPRLIFDIDASEHDLYYMFDGDPVLAKKRWNSETSRLFSLFRRQHENYRRAMLQLFSDVEYAQQLDLRSLNDQLFLLASNAQNTIEGQTHSFLDIYNDEEIYANWQIFNVRNYLTYGASPFNGGQQPFTQRRLLQKIIEQADSCIAQSTSNVTLRFGHDSNLMPLVCLMGINGYDQTIYQLEQLESRGWIDYKVFPLAGNVQIIFYRTNPQDDDVLVKVLLNENEVSLPIPTDCTPYYHWKDVRQYYVKKLSNNVTDN